MKYLRVLIYFAVLPIFFYSCKKDNAATNRVYSSSIIGSWELESAQNGQTTTRNYPVGNKNILQFTDAVYKKFTDGNLVATGQYRIVPDASAMEQLGLNIAPGQFTSRIIFDNDTATRKNFLQISNNSLQLLSGYFPLDGGTSFLYGRKQE